MKFTHLDEQDPFNLQSVFDRNNKSVQETSIMALI